MQVASQEVLDALRDLGSATVFNAVVAVMGGSQGGFELEKAGGMPVNYTDGTLRCLLPDLGAAVGYAATCELTTNDPDTTHIPWNDYYDALERTPGPKVAVLKDVDTRPGRGAAFGDGMAATHRLLGVTGAAVDGTVRDLVGIQRVGLPVWGRGLVPGHGVFRLVSINRPVVACGVLIKPGELLVADIDGLTKIPFGMDAASVVREGEKIRRREAAYHAEFRKPGATLAGVRDWVKKNV